MKRQILSRPLMKNSRKNTLSDGMTPHLMARARIWMEGCDEDDGNPAFHVEHTESVIDSNTVCCFGAHCILLCYHVVV